MSEHPTIQSEEIQSVVKRPIPGYEGYMADSLGRVWSCETNWRGYGERCLSCSPDRYGYMKVRLLRDGKRVKIAVHKLVALAFWGIPKTGQQVRHLNGIRLDNRPLNLKWGTPKENADDRLLHGNTMLGTKNPFSKLSEMDVVKIKSILLAGKEAYGSHKKIAAQFGISSSVISKIARKAGWKHVA